MAFVKTGIAFRKPEVVEVPRVGDVKDGLVWDGREWVPIEIDLPKDRDDVKEGEGNRWRRD